MPDLRELPPGRPPWEPPEDPGWLWAVRAVLAMALIILVIGTCCGLFGALRAALP